MIKKKLLVLLLLTNIDVCFSQEASSGNSQDRCAVVMQDSELKITKRLMLKHLTPFTDFYGDENITFNAMKDESSKSKTKAIDASVDKIAECIRSGKKVNFLVFAHTNDYPSQVLTKLKKKFEKSNINISDHLEFVYNSGCANGVDGGEVTELGAKLYIGHGTKGVSCSPVWLFNFFKNLRFMDQNPEVGIMNAVAIANHKFDHGDAPGINFCPDEEGEEKEVVTQAFVRKKSQTNVIDALESESISELFPLASNIDMIKQLTCLDLRVVFDYHKKIIKEYLDDDFPEDTFEKEIKRASWDSIASTPGGYQGFIGLKCDEKIDMMKKSIEKRFDSKIFKCSKKKCYPIVPEDRARLSFYKFECTKKGPNALLCEIKNAASDVLQSKMIRCDEKRELSINDHQKYSYNSGAPLYPVFHDRLYFKSDFDSESQSSWHQQFPKPFHIKGSVLSSTKIPTGETTREFYGKDLNGVLPIENNNAFIPDLFYKVIEDRYNSICRKSTTPVDKMSVSNAGRNSIKPGGSGARDVTIDLDQSKGSSN